MRHIFLPPAFALGLLLAGCGAAAPSPATSSTPTEPSSPASVVSSVPTSADAPSSAPEFRYPIPVGTAVVGLRESGEWFPATIAAAVEGTDPALYAVAFTDAPTTIQSLSPDAVAMTGISYNVTVGQPVIAKGPRTAWSLAILAARDSYSGEMAVLFDDGSVKTVTMAEVATTVSGNLAAPASEDPAMLIGSAVLGNRNDQWLPATLKAVFGGKYVVAYDDGIGTSNVLAAAEIVRLPDAPATVAAGDRVIARKFSDVWAAATVKDVAAEGVNVLFEGSEEATLVEPGDVVPAPAAPSPARTE